MRISLEIQPEAITAVARVINADAIGEGYTEDDHQVRDDLCHRIVAQAFFNGLQNKDTAQATDRDRKRFGKVRRAGRLPRARRASHSQ